jgi:hypothetical protein
MVLGGDGCCLDRFNTPASSVGRSDGVAAGSCLRKVNLRPFCERFQIILISRHDANRAKDKPSHYGRAVGKGGNKVGTHTAKHLPTMDQDMRKGLTSGKSPCTRHAADAAAQAAKKAEAAAKGKAAKSQETKAATDAEANRRPPKRQQRTRQMRQSRRQFVRIHKTLTGVRIDSRRCGDDRDG